MTTPNLSLIQSDPLLTLGPTWAQGLETNMVLIDQHDHSPGKGLPVPVSGLNINANLPFQNNDGTGIRALAFTSQVSSLAGTAKVYVKNGDLFYIDGSGVQIQLTSGGTVNVSGVGGITGLASTTAAVTYSNLIKTFSFTQDASNPANIDAGTVTVREPGVVSPNGISLKSPTSLVGSYDLTLFSSLPASTKLVQLTSAGLLQSVLDVDNASIEIASNALQLKDNGTALTKLEKLAARSVLANATNALNNVGALTTTSGSNAVLQETGSGTLAWAKIRSIMLNDGIITQAKLATVNTASGGTATGSTTAIVPPGANDVSVTLTVQNANRPVRLILQSGGGDSHIGVARTTTAVTAGSLTMFVGLYVDGVQVEVYSLQLWITDGAASGGSGVGTGLKLPSVAIQFERYDTAGLHTYGLRFWVNTATATGYWNSIALRATEL